MDRRELGVQKLDFIDGTSRDITISAVGNYEMMKLRRQFRKTKLDKNGNIDSVDFEDENFVLAVLDVATGVQISKSDLMNVENDLKDLHDKYFKKELNNSKKAKLADTSEPNQDKQSEE